MSASLFLFFICQGVRDQAFFNLERKLRNIAKILEPLGERETKITLPTRFRDSFSRYLAKRKLVLDPPYKTENWNGVESAYTFFSLPVPSEVADLIFDD
jgi:hypothetical protein